MNFQNVGVADLCACSGKISAGVGSSAQTKQDNHDRDEGGNRSESFDDRCRHRLIFSIFGNLPLGRPGNSRKKRKSSAFSSFCFCDVTCGSLVEFKICPISSSGCCRCFWISGLEPGSRRTGRPLAKVKRTSRNAPKMSADDPKRSRIRLPTTDRLGGHRCSLTAPCRYDMLAFLVEENGFHGMPPIAGARSTSIATQINERGG